MKISILKDYGIDNIRNISSIKPVLEGINIEGSDIQLDLCECGIDYPATSKIIDKILNQLSQKAGTKKFEILYDFNINEVAVHRSLFYGSDYFNIKEDDISLPIEGFKEKIRKVLSEKEINMVIRIVDSAENEKVINYETRG